MTSITDHGLPTLHALRAAYADGSLKPSAVIAQLLERIAAVRGRREYFNPALD